MLYRDTSSVVSLSIYAQLNSQLGINEKKTPRALMDRRSARRLEQIQLPDRSPLIRQPLLLSVISLRRCHRKEGKKKKVQFGVLAALLLWGVAFLVISGRRLCFRRPERNRPGPGKGSWGTGETNTWAWKTWRWGTRSPPPLERNDPFQRRVLDLYLLVLV